MTSVALLLALAAAPIANVPETQATGQLDLSPVAATSSPVPQAGSSGETLARPVFSPTRRPYVRPEREAIPEEDLPAERYDEEPAEPTPQADQIALSGVYISDDTRRAFIVSPTAPEGEWLPIGAGVSGWELTHIEAGSVTISAPPQEVILQLYGEKSEKDNLNLDQE